MPLTKKGKKVLRAMRHEYGAGKGRQVFYASVNKGTLKGVHKRHHSPEAALSPGSIVLEGDMAKVFSR